MLQSVLGIAFMPEADYGTSTRWLTVILVDPGEFGANSDAIRRHLETSNIEARPVWKPMHLQPIFSGVARYRGEVSEGIFNRGLGLPSGSEMNKTDVARVVETLIATPR